MKKILIVLLACLCTQIEVCCEVLTGGLIYNVEDIKKSSLKKVVKELPVNTIKGRVKDLDFCENKNAIKSGIYYSDRDLVMFDLGNAEVYAVCFKNDPKYTYYYWSDTGKLKSVAIEEQYNKQTYPKIQYHYNNNGIFTHLIVKVSPTEAYIYNKAGKLNSHWIGDRAYNKNKRLVGEAYRVRQVD